MKLLCLSVSPELSYFQFMQDPNNSNTSKMHVKKGMPPIAATGQELRHDIHFISRFRKPWYQRAIEMATMWKIINFKITKEISTTSNPSLWKTNSSKSSGIPTTNSNSNSNSNRSNKLRKCISLKVATSFSRVCLCAPISSYNEVFRAHEVLPRRSNSYPRSKPLPTTSLSQEVRVISNARHSVEGRKIFRGKSLTDDVLMRQFVIEEEAMMQVRRRNEMEVIRKRSVMRRKKLGPSRLSRMVMAEAN